MGKDQTFMGGRGGDGYAWRAPVRCDGSPAVPYFRATGTVVFLLAGNDGAGPYILTCHKDSEGVRTDDGSYPLASVPYVGSMATALSELGS